MASSEQSEERGNPVDLTDFPAAMLHDLYKTPRTGCRPRSFFYFLLIATLSLGWLLGQTKAAAPELLINEVQISGGAGLTKNDYVKFFNNSPAVIDLKGYRLVKRSATASQDTTIKSWTEPTPLNSRGFYLWANSTDGFAESIGADCSTTATLAENNSLALRRGAEDIGAIVDAISWGDTALNGLGLDKHYPNPESGKIMVNSPEPPNEPATTENPPPAGNEGGGLDTGGDEDPGPSQTPTSNATTTINETTNTTADESSPSAPPELLISEIRPNPRGPDDQIWSDFEFVELFNISSSSLDLADWQIMVGTQSPYRFNHLTLAPQTYFSLKRDRSRLALNNQQDAVKLYRPDEKTPRQTVSWRQAAEGLSYVYSQDDKSWRWTTTPTPGLPNQLTPPNQAPRAVITLSDEPQAGRFIIFDGSDSYDAEGATLTYEWRFSDGSSAIASSLARLLSKTDSNVILTVSDGDLSNSQTLTLLPAANSPKTKTPTVATNESPVAIASDAAAGLATITGIVTAPVGWFGTQYFYLMPLDESGQTIGRVIQVYNNKKDFPQLAIGDYLEIRGELYDITNDTRLKIAAASAITVLDHDYSLIGQRLTIQELKPELHNRLITVSGAVTEKKNDGVWLDDGGGEIFIGLKPVSGLAAKYFTLSDNYQVTGLLRQESSGLKLWPRSERDIMALTDADSAAGDPAAAPNETPAAPVKSVSGQWQFWQYLTIASWGLSACLLVLLVKDWRRQQKNRS